MTELEAHLRAYLLVLAEEHKDQLLKATEVYHDLKRMLGDYE